MIASLGSAATTLAAAPASGGAILRADRCVAWPVSSGGRRGRPRASGADEGGGPAGRGRADSEPGARRDRLHSLPERGRLPVACCPDLQELECPGGTEQRPGCQDAR